MDGFSDLKRTKEVEQSCQLYHIVFKRGAHIAIAGAAMTAITHSTRGRDLVIIEQAVESMFGKRHEIGQCHRG